MQENMPKKKVSTGKKKFFKQKKDLSQEIALKRINELFKEAEEVFEEDKTLANRYVFLARKLATKYKVSFSKEQKIRFCKFCGSYLKQGINAKIRLSKGNIVINCASCKHIRRFKYK